MAVSQMNIYGSMQNDRVRREANIESNPPLCVHVHGSHCPQLIDTNRSDLALNLLGASIQQHAHDVGFVLEHGEEQRSGILLFECMSRHDAGLWCRMVLL